MHRPSVKELHKRLLPKRKPGQSIRPKKQDGAATVYNIYWDFSSLAGEQVFFPVGRRGREIHQLFQLRRFKSCGVPN